MGFGFLERREEIAGDRNSSTATIMSLKFSIKKLDNRV